MNLQILERLLDISRSMAENRVLDPLLEYAMGVALDLFNGENGYLVLVNPDGSWDFRVRRSRSGGQIEAPNSRISKTILDRVIASGKPEMTADAILDPKFQTSASVTALRLRSVMSAPLVSRGTVMGAMYIENRSEGNMFKEDDLRALQYFAAQAAVAIENAILNDELESRVFQRTSELQQLLTTVEEYNSRLLQANQMLEKEIQRRRLVEEELQRLAAIDSLTGVNNRRRFFELGEEIVANALVYGHVLSVLMIDADFFKQVNDTFGHQAGDQALRTTAFFIKQHTRPQDVLGRYGGEEFAVLLPGLDLEQARQVAEKMRASVSDHPIETVGGLVPVTISLGAAQLDRQRDEDIDSLLERADKALYDAKETGRNQVCVRP